MTGRFIDIPSADGGEERHRKIRAAPRLEEERGFWGFYSLSCDRDDGHCIYLDGEGKEVKVTAVMSDPDVNKGFEFYHNIKDIVCVGKVYKYVRSNHKGEMRKALYYDNGDAAFGYI